MRKPTIKETINALDEKVIKAIRKEIAKEIKEFHKIEKTESHGPCSFGMCTCIDIADMFKE